MRTERFAPSPTGPLHLGHAYSAVTAWLAAQNAHGRFLLRIEDIDQSRARPQWEAQIYDDLAWLGLDWEHPVMRQSERSAAYRAALETLAERGLLYACDCTRRDIESALSAPQEGVPVGPDGVIYPGTCRTRGLPLFAGHAMRLDMEHAATSGLSFRDNGTSHTVTADELITGIGDIVLARRDMGTSYHLSVVVDDAAQGITHVTRGRDLFEATAIHVMLQHLLGLPTPEYMHHRLIRDETGKRLAKRDDARAIATYRMAGETPSEVLARVGL